VEKRESFRYLHWHK